MGRGTVGVVDRSIGQAVRVAVMFAGDMDEAALLDPLRQSQRFFVQLLELFVAHSF